MGFLKNIITTIKNNLDVNNPDAWLKKAEEGYGKFSDECESYISRENIPPRYYNGQLLQGMNPVFTEKYVEKFADYYNTAPYIADGPSEEERRRQADDDFIRRQDAEDNERARIQQEYDDLLLFNIIMSEQDPEWNDN